MKIRVTYLEHLKAATPDWGDSPACRKLREHLRQIYTPALRPEEKEGIPPSGTVAGDSAGNQAEKERLETSGNLTDKAGGF